MDIISKWLAAFVLLLGPMAAHAQSYTFTDLGTLGGSASVASGINNTGQVVGWSYDANGIQTATLWSGSTATALGFFAGSSPAAISYATGINNDAQIAGVIVLDGGFPTEQATLWTGTTPSALGGGLSYALAINDAGAAVGSEATVDGGYSAAIEWNGATSTTLLAGVECFCQATAINNVGQVVVASSGGPVLFNGTTPTFLDSLGAEGGAYPTGINDAGQIVGWGFFFENYTTQAFLWNGTTATILGTLGGQASEALAINQAGQIVGWSSYANPPDNLTRATLWEGATAIDLNTLVTLPAGFVLNQATAINDSGQIVGSGTNSANETHAFLLTPPAQIPTVTPLITGTLGTNGWYVTPTTTIAWTVTGLPPPATSGCSTVNVPQTTGTTYTCAASNATGGASDSVTIREDSVPPKVSIKIPVKGKTYALRAKVLASYSCLDTTSGVASCTGTVKDGARINTSTAGTKTFQVIGVDDAGNQTTTSVLYSVN